MIVWRETKDVSCYAYIVYKYSIQLTREKIEAAVLQQQQHQQQQHQQQQQQQQRWALLLLGSDSSFISHRLASSLQHVIISPNCVWKCTRLELRWTMLMFDFIVARWWGFSCRFSSVIEDWLECLERVAFFFGRPRKMSMFIVLFRCLGLWAFCCCSGDYKTIRWVNHSKKCQVLSLNLTMDLLLNDSLQCPMSFDP